MILTLYAKALRKLRGTALTDSHVHPTSKIEPGSRLTSSTFDRHSYCGYDCSFVHVDVGSFCSIANGVTIGGAQHPVHFLSTSPTFLSHRDSVKAKFAEHVYNPAFRTTVGNDVWIGERALIKAGVTIGHGAVIGMGAVVTRDIPPYAIVAGNPARLIRMRFSQPVIDGLLKLRWWDFSDDDLRRIGPIAPEPETLLRQEGLL